MIKQITIATQNSFEQEIVKSYFKLKHNISVGVDGGNENIIKVSGPGTNGKFWLSIPIINSKQSYEDSIEFSEWQNKWIEEPIFNEVMTDIEEKLNLR